MRCVVKEIKLFGQQSNGHRSEGIKSLSQTEILWKLKWRLFWLWQWNKIRNKIPDLHSFGPVAHVLPQEQVVEGSGADKVENLFEDQRDDLRIKTVLWQRRVEPGEDKMAKLKPYHFGIFRLFNDFLLSLLRSLIKQKSLEFR